MGLLGPDGAELATRLEKETESREGTRVITLAEPSESFRFVDVPAPPVPSLLRGFSAPVKLKDVPLERLKFLAINDSEPFARWEAGQQVATRVLLEGIRACRSGAKPAV
jgi:aminopeptidase N